MSLVTLLSRQDVCNNVVSIKKPLSAKDVENIKHGRLISGFLSSIWSGIRRE